MSTRKLIITGIPEMQLGPDAKRCPPGYKRIRGTRRCQKKVTAAQKIKPSAPKPSAPKPSAPKPSVPKPSAPKSSAPKPMSISIEDNKRCPRGYAQTIKRNGRKICVLKTAKQATQKSTKKPPSVSAKSSTAIPTSKPETGVITLREEEKRCPKGYQRVKGTRKCAPRGNAAPKAAPKIVAKTSSEAPSKIVLSTSSKAPGEALPRTVTLSPDAKRCPTGYSRVPGTRTCRIKRSARSTTKKLKKETKPSHHLTKAMLPKPARPSVLKTVPLKFPSAGPDYAPEHPLEAGPITLSPSVNEMLLKTAGTGAESDGWVVSASQIVSGKVTYSRVDSSGEVERVTMKWDSKRAQAIALTNLINEEKMHGKINCSKVRGPKQYFANCWFNTFFVVFFISDKGRKAFRHLRQAMITGVIPASPKTPEATVPQPYRKALFFLDAMISSSLRGTLEDTVDTNEVVQALNKATRKVLNKAVFPLINKFSNPIAFYSKLIAVLNGSATFSRWSDYKDTIPLRIYELSVYFNDISWLMKKRASATALMNKLFNKENAPHCLVIHTNEITQAEQKSKAGRWWKDEGKKKSGFGKEFTLQLLGGETQKYALDSVVIRDVKKRHFVAFVQCNKRGYVFDGASSKRELWPVEWRSMATGGKLSSLVIPPSDPKVYLPLTVSFTFSYQIAMYYRVE